MVYKEAVESFMNTDQKLPEKYQVIYLNGPSSAGKTTLAKALQDILDPPFLHIGIDRVIGMMPERINNWEGGPAPLGYSWRESKDHEGKPIHLLQMGPFARKMSDTYLQIVTLLARLGHSLIIDDVSLDKADSTRWSQFFQEFRVLRVGLKVPLSILEEREKARGNRMLGSARGQFHSIEFDETYDLLIDSSSLSLQECADLILKKMTANG